MTTYIWLSSSGDWASPSNWLNAQNGSTPAGPPGAGDTALLIVTATISGTGSANTVLLAANAPVTLTGVLTVGTLGLPDDTHAGGNFVLNVNGSSASLSVTSNLIVGIGDVLDIDGGKVSSPGTGQVGFLDAGSVTIEGGGSLTGSALIADGALLVQSGSVAVATLDVGSYQGAPGSMDIAAGSTVTDTFALIGITAGNTTSVSVTGGNWTTDTLVLSAGTVTLAISAGGTVDVAGGVAAFPGAPADLVFGVGRNATDSGTVTVSGTGARLSITGDGWFGAVGTADATASAGGRIDLTGTLSAGVSASGLGRIDLSGGSTLNVGGDGQFGLSGTGDLTVEAGSSATFGGTFGIGGSAGGNGVVRVTGTGAALTATNAVFVADDGGGTLSIDGGGSVEGGTLTVAAHTGTGSLEVTGGTLTVDGFAYLGSRGTASVTIGAAGTLSVGDSLEVGYRQGATATVGIDGGHVTVASDVLVGDSGNATLTLDSAGTLADSGTLAVGFATTGVGAMTIASAGSATVTGAVGIGGSAGSQGMLRVTGTDSKLSTTNTVFVADYGSGTLSVQSNASVDAGTLTVGAHTGSGSLDVTGSRMTVTGFAYLGSRGSATVSIGTSGTLSIGDSLEVGFQAGASGTVGIDGGAITVGADALIGDQGEANVSISASGTLSVAGSLDAGTVATGTATLDVSGTDALVEADADATFGDNGVATVSVGTGASLTVAGTLALGLAGAGGGTLTVAGGAVMVTGDAHFGDAGTGDVTLSANGTLSVGGTLSEGLQADSDGSLTVDDASATLTLASDWIIGVAGTHDDAISAAATVALGGALILGSAASGDGALTLDGGASLSVGQGLTLGDAGSGSLDIGGGATLSTTGTLVLGAQQGSDGTITLAGTSSLAPGGDLTVGDAGSGSIDIGQGGTLATSGAVVLGNAMGGDGTVMLGQDVTLAPAGDLTVGKAGDGSIDIAAGATLDGSAGSFVIADAAGGTGTISLRGTNAEIVAQDLTVGGGGTGLLTVAADTTLTVNGDLTLGRDHGGGGTITVSVTGDASVGGDLVVGAAGGGSLDVNGGSLTVFGSISIADAVGGTGDLTFGNATLNVGTLTVGNAGVGSFSANTTADVTATMIEIGAVAGGSGTFNLDGHGSQVQAGSLNVGDGGTGALQVTDSAAFQVAGAALMGVDSAALTPEGATIESNASWTMGGALIVGEAARAGVTIDSGGGVAAASVVLGDQDSGSGTISATGSATLASALGFGALLQVGNFGTGALALSLGAHAGVGTTGGTVEIAANASAEGRVTLTDSGTTLQTHLLTVGGNATAEGGAGVLSIGAGAVVAVSDATIWATGSVALAGGTLTTDPVAVLGTVGGHGVLGGTVVDTGMIAASGGTLALTGPVTGTGTLSVAAGAELSLGAAAAALTISVAASGAALHLESLAAMRASVVGFGFGDTLTLDGVTADGGTLDGGVLTLTQSGAQVGTLALSATVSRAGFSVSNSGGVTSVAEAPCFAAGTRIAAPGGGVAVEALRPGDSVLLARGGSAPVRWVGHRAVRCDRHPNPDAVWPIRVAAGAFGRGKPARDLWLSPDHAVRVRGALIPIRCLANGATIRQERVARITYHHVELDRHDVLLAEGLPAESYLDTGNRRQFTAEAGVRPMFPDFSGGDAAASQAAFAARGCGPLLLDGPEVAAAHARLLRRAHTLGHRLTGNAALHIEADAPGLAMPNATTLHVPHGARVVRLRSRSFVPALLDAPGRDTRRLGVALAITSDGAALPEAAFVSGWHAPDKAAAWRWTDGDATLALAGKTSLSLRLVQAGARYWEAPVSRRRAAGRRS